MSRLKSFSIIFIVVIFLGGLLLLKKFNVDSPTPLYLELPDYFPNLNQPKENPITIEGVSLGRFLFYDQNLSKDGTISCATCHQQSRAFTDGLGKSIGMDGKEADFSALSLANVGFVTRLTWEGHDKNLEMQALKPLVRIKEMDQRLSVLTKKIETSKFYKKKFRAAFGTTDITPKVVAKALAQFQRTLISSNSKYDSYLKGKISLSEQELLGLKLFSTSPDPVRGIRGAGCINCHQAPLFHENKFRNNGLYKNPWAGLIRRTFRDEDLGKFRVPTLRNIEVTAPYMHFGNFSTLEMVLDNYSTNIQPSETLDKLLYMSNEIIGSGEPLGIRLTENEKKAIIAFLKTLTDYKFLNDSRFDNPYIEDF